MISYNPQVASYFGRWKRIFQLLIPAQFICLQGTKDRASPWQGSSQYYTIPLASHIICSWHAGSGEFTNSSTGVAVALLKSNFQCSYIKQIFSPPSELQGRGGAVYFVKPSFPRVLVFSLYFPASGSVEFKRLVIKKFCDWAQEVVNVVERFVKTLTGKTITLHVEASDTIDTANSDRAPRPKRQQICTSMGPHMAACTSLCVTHCFGWAVPLSQPRKEVPNRGSSSQAVARSSMTSGAWTWSLTAPPPEGTAAWAGRWGQSANSCAVTTGFGDF